MAAGKAYQDYHLEEEMKSQLLHAQLLLYPSQYHRSSSSKQLQTTARSYHEYEWKQGHTRRPRQRLPNWVTCEPGMYPVFLGPTPKSSCGGTGVFLPQIPPLHFQTNTKPPLRPPPPPPHAASGGQERGCGNNNNNNKKGKGSNFSLQSRRSSSNSNSPGVFLPKEWTY